MSKLANSKRIYEVLSRLPHPYTEADGVFFVQSIARSADEFAWSILLDDRYIGTISLVTKKDRLPTLGYWLGEPFWGHGYATEAAMAVVAAAEAAGAAGLQSRALLTNSGSRNVLRKLGFAQMGEGVDDTGTLTGRRVALLEMAFER